MTDSKYNCSLIFNYLTPVFVVWAFFFFSYYFSVVVFLPQTGVMLTVLLFVGSSLLAFCILAQNELLWSTGIYWAGRDLFKSKINWLERSSDNLFRTLGCKLSRPTDFKMFTPYWSCLKSFLVTNGLGSEFTILVL